MQKSENASTLNALFLVFAGAGFIMIFGSENADPALGYFAPTGVVMLYALVVASTISNWEDRSLAEHHLDAIYFLGFLFTLFSLITLFYRLQNGSADGSATDGSADGTAQLSRALTYIGISVSTSIAGVLFRSIARGSYLSRHPERSVDTIEAFLAERAETTQALREKEEQYLSALEHYVEATERFSGGLDDCRELLLPGVEALSRVLTDQTSHLREVSDLSRRFGDTMAGIERRAAAAPWEAVTEELEGFQRGVGELNQVLDSLFTVLEHKVERIR